MNLRGGTVLIVGIGNELLGDEGLGVQVARALRAALPALPPGVEVLEAGTSLLDLLPEMHSYARVILVDAIRGGREPGTVYRVESLAGLAGQCAAAVPVSAHEWDLVETLRLADSLDLLPRQLSLVGAEPENMNPGLELSPRLKAAAAAIVSLLLAEASPAPGCARV